MMTFLAYRPFIDSLESAVPGADGYWLWFILPLLIAICLVYKGTKVSDLHDLPRQAGKMFAQIVVVMAAAGIAVRVVLWVLMNWA